MDEVLSSTVEIDTTNETVYRNQPVPLYVEPEELTPDEQRKSRVSARFDRSHWAPEYWHGFQPTRSKYALNGVNTSYNQHSFGKGEQLEKPKHVHGHTKEALQAVPMHGTYKLLEVYRTESLKGLVVKAQCTGEGCGGNYVRTFRARDWLDLNHYQSCTLCKGVLMRKDADIRYKETVKHQHGAWAFESMTRMHGQKAMYVTGKCTGPTCGGWKRNFQFNHWQNDKMAMDGCHMCCAAANDVDADEVRCG